MMWCACLLIHNVFGLEMAPNKLTVLRVVFLYIYIYMFFKNFKNGYDISILVYNHNSQKNKAEKLQITFYKIVN